MSYDDIFLFIKLINIGTFTELAKLINVSQSTVSRRIQNLEESMNTKLIKRNSRGLVEMTAEGKILYKSFCDIEVKANDTLQKLLNSSKEIQGILKVGLPKIFFDNVIADKLDIFYTRYPNVKIIFSYAVKVTDLVKDGIDVAITTKKPEVNNCTIKTLVKAKSKLYASKKYVQEKGVPKRVKDLKNHRIMGFVDHNECQNNLIGISEENGLREEVDIEPKIFLSNAIYDINLTTKCNSIINTLNIFVSNKDNVIPILEEYYFGETSFYLVRDVGIRNNLEQEFIKFIDVCLQNYKLF